MNRQILRGEREMKSQKEVIFLEKARCFRSLLTPPRIDAIDASSFLLLRMCVSAYASGNSLRLGASDSLLSYGKRSTVGRQL